MYSSCKVLKIKYLVGLLRGILLIIIIRTNFKYNRAYVFKQEKLKKMRKKHSSFYYIFWLSVPVIIGIFSAWGAQVGAKIAYSNFKPDEGTLSMASTTTQKSEAIEEDIGSDSGDEEMSDVHVEPSIMGESIIVERDYSFLEENIKKSDDAERPVPDDTKDAELFMRTIENSLPKKPVLEVTALAYLAADLDSGEILVEKNKDKILPIASVSKLVTALVSLETLSQDTAVTISGSAVDTYGTAGGLFVGEKISTGNLLYPLLLESSNDAAEAIAGSKNRASFIKSMNQTVDRIGASRTSFFDASGLSEDNVSTPDDLSKIAQYIYKNQKSIFDITRIKSYVLKNHTWENPTYFLRMNAYIGGKNGYTDEAGRTAVSLFSIPERSGPPRNVIVVVLKSFDRNADIASIVNYIAEIEFPELNGNTLDEDRMMEFY